MWHKIICTLGYIPKSHINDGIGERYAIRETGHIFLLNLSEKISLVVNNQNKKWPEKAGNGFDSQGPSSLEF